MKKLFNIALLLTVIAAFAQVDMFNRKVTATGRGEVNPEHKTMAQKRFGALKAAEASALRSIIEQINGMPIDANTVVRDLALESDVIKTETEGIAKYFEIVGGPRYMDDGSVELDIELSLNNLDWAGKVVQAVGVGSGKNRSLALRAAEVDAKRQLLERVKGMYLAASTLIKDGSVEGDVIDIKTQGVLRNATMVKGSEKYMDDNSVEVICEVKLGDDLQTVPGFSSVLMKDMDFDEEYPIVPQATYKLSDVVKDEVFTGLIVDCTGVNLVPALAPKIFSASGKEVYGSSMVSQSYATQQGMIGYDRKIENARSNPRVANNPLVIKATGVKGTNKVNIVISDEDAAKIESAAKQLKFLGECKVMAIVK